MASFSVDKPCTVWVGLYLRETRPTIEGLKEGKGGLQHPAPFTCSEVDRIFALDFTGLK